LSKKPNKKVNLDVAHLDHTDKIKLIYLLQEKNILLEEKYVRLEKRFKALEARLEKNSSNSSKPPSSDGNNSGKKNPKKTTSSRKKSGKKPGGQAGHKGSHLEMSASPDKVVILEVDSCAHCKNALSGVKPQIEIRQEFEIPEPKINVIEYQSEHKYCKACGYITSACFPERITHKTQYGPRAKSLMVYINQYQIIPFKRASEFFATVYNQQVSPGTIVNAVNALSTRFVQVEGEIKLLLTNSSLVHTDETGVNISGNKKWMHIVGNQELTHYGIHTNRGRKASEDIGILPKFRGTMVHDHWKSYFTYKDSRHSLCNAHHIRELRFLFEHHNIKWAKNMSNFLIETNEEKTLLLKGGKNKLSPQKLKSCMDAYDEIVKKASREHRYRVTNDSKNLLKRFKGYKDCILLFITDFSVPFTNNLGERDLRMNKVKQKISGCFRSKNGGDNFCKIRSVISTTRKNKKNVFNILQEAFEKIICADDLLADNS
jgi:transposase